MDNGQENNVQAAQAAAFEAELQELDQVTDPDYDPDAAEAAQAEAKALEVAEAEGERQAGQAAAWAGILGIEKAVKLFVHPRFDFTDEEKQYAVENFAPVLIKYGTGAVGWAGAIMAKYGEEISAIKGVVVIGKASIERVNGLREEDAKAAAEAAKQQAYGGENAAGTA